MPRPPREELTETAYSKIKQMIFDHDIKPGERIGQERLASIIGVSRTPILAALARLEHEMLVVTIPRRGAFVREYSHEDFLKIIDIRLRLEPLGAAGAAMNATEVEIIKLKHIIEDFSQAVEADDREAEKRIDFAFHHTMHEMSRNQFLMRLIGSMNLIAVSNLKGLITPAELSLKLHREIYDAIKARDVKGAETAMVEHLQNTRSKLLSSIEKTLKAAQPSY